MKGRCTQGAARKETTGKDDTSGKGKEGDKGEASGKGKEGNTNGKGGDKGEEGQKGQKGKAVKDDDNTDSEQEGAWAASPVGKKKRDRSPAASDGSDDDEEEARVVKKKVGRSAKAKSASASDGGDESDEGEEEEEEEDEEEGEEEEEDEDEDEGEGEEEEEDEDEEDNDDAPPVEKKRGPGRPPKAKPVQAVASPAKRGPGRPPKDKSKAKVKPTEVIVIDDDEEEEEAEGAGPMVRTFPPCSLFFALTAHTRTQVSIEVLNIAVTMSSAVNKPWMDGATAMRLLQGQSLAFQELPSTLPKVTKVNGREAKVVHIINNFRFNDRVGWMIVQFIDDSTIQLVNYCDDDADQSE